MNNAMNVSQIAFSDYQAYTGFQSINGLQQSRMDAVNGRAASWSRVDFGFHSVSAYITAERTLTSNGEYFIEVQSDPHILAAAGRRPGGTGTAEMHSPVGDAVLPLLIMLTGYVLMRIRRHMAGSKCSGK